MEDSTTMKIGGKKSSLRYGNLLKRIASRISKIGDKYISKGSATVVSNPSYKFINPFTLLINFTVDNTDKYQLIIEGEYKTKYKMYMDESNTIDVIPNGELFDLIDYGSGNWFLKE